MGQLLNKLATLVDPSTAVVAHVGAHRGQEVPAYRGLGFARVVLIEPIPEVAVACRRTAKGVDGYSVIEAAVVDAATSEPVALHVTANTQMSSLLPPLDAKPDRDVTVRGAPLALLVPNATVAVVDVQGSELDVVASAPESLRCAVVETRTVAEYAGGPLHDEVDGQMRRAGWTAVWSRHHARPEVLDTIYTRDTPWLGF